MNISELSVLEYKQDVNVKAIVNVFLKDKSGVFVNPMKYESLDGSSYFVAREGCIEIESGGHTCRQTNGCYIRYVLMALKKIADNLGLTISIVPIANVEGKTYYAADGIILSGPYNSFITSYINNAAEREKIKHLLDIFVANTAVLLNQKYKNETIEWRKNFNYNFNIPSATFLYSGLTNFWFSSYELMSVVYALIRFVSNVYCQDFIKEYIKTIFSLVNLDDIKRAIETQDFELAKSNFDKLVPFMCRLADTENGNNHYCINKHTINNFNYFISVPMDEWFPNHINAWQNFNSGNGFEKYLENVVYPERINTRIKIKPCKLENIWGNSLTT